MTVLTRCGLPRPVSCLAAEKPSPCLADTVYWPPLVRGRVLWPLGSTTEASAIAFRPSSRAFHQAAWQQEPSYRVNGVLTDGCASTPKSRRTLFPGARRGLCLRHALLTRPKQLAAIPSPRRQARRTQCHPLGYRARRRQSLRVLALGQR